MTSQLISDKYEIIQKIGEGSSGIVYKAREIGSYKIVTLKQIKYLSETDEKSYEQAFNEILILKKLKGNKNIIDILDYEIDEQEKCIYIIYEYNEYSLHDLIYQEMPMKFEQVKYYFIQMLKSIETLHNNGIIHCDIKPDNYLITNDNEIKLIDFSLSIKSDDIIKYNKNKVYQFGTHGYMAPEVLLGSSKYDKEIDIWSLACSFYEILTQEKLIDNHCSEYDIICQMIQIFGFPTKDDFPNIDEFYGKDLFLKNQTSQKTTLDEILDKKLRNEFKVFKPILKGMLQMNPKSRLSISEILKFPIFNESEMVVNLPKIAMSEKIFDTRTKDNKYHKKKLNKFVNEFRPLKIIPCIEV